MFPVTEVSWQLNSTVALHWINGNGYYKQLVRNRVKKIPEKQYIQWRHVSTAANPADIDVVEVQLSNFQSFGGTDPHGYRTSATRESESKVVVGKALRRA